MLKKKALAVANSDNQVLVPIAEVMLRKLDSYNSLVCSDLVRFAKPFDPIFASDVISDSDLLRKVVRIPDQDQELTERSEDIGKKNLFEQLMDENSVDVAEKVEIGRYIRATSWSNRGMGPLIWWKDNQHRYSNITLLSRDILAIQSSSVASEGTFSHATHVLDEARLRMND